MSPFLEDSPAAAAAHMIRMKSEPVCSDPMVVPPKSASRRTKEMWWLHGDPHSKRYSDPKLLSLGALVSHNGLAYGDQPAFLYPVTADLHTPYDTMTWIEFDRITDALALIYAAELQRELQEANISQIQPTVALLAGGKTIEYFCTELALQKLGLRVLLLAEQNAVSAVHYLLETCKCLVVITDSKNADVDANGLRKLVMIEDLLRDCTIKQAQVEAVKFKDFGDVWERHSFIIHSSGSTGVPKPIIHTNRSMMLIARMYRLFPEFDVQNWFLLFPLYHIAGISSGLSGLPNGQVLSFPPLSWPPSSSSIFAAWKTLSDMGYPVDNTHCAPTIIENMYEYILETGGDFTPLSSLKVLQPGGAALSDSIVKTLAENGVNVKTTYGSTETGPPLRPMPHTHANPKCYTFRNLYPDNDKLKFDEIGEGLYELVVYKGFELAAELWEGLPDDEPYRTNDLFTEDPVGSGFYRLQGRKDDIIVHSNGENTSANPLQIDIQTYSKAIKKAIALGHSRPCVSLLVEVNDGYDPTSASIQDEIWEAVKEVNTQYPGHSRIIRSMICFLPKGSSLPTTPKGNVKRKEAERLYSKEVSALYAGTTDQSLLNGISVNSSANEPMDQYLRNLFASLSNTPTSEIQEWTTLYDLGIDSRLALTLHASISQHLGPISLGSIFENPSIAQLLTFFRSKSVSYAAPAKDTSAETTKRILSRLTAELHSWPPRPEGIYHPSASSETILLTGATGSLGTALLEALVPNSRVRKIYALIRGGASGVQKLTDALCSRGLDGAALLGSGKIEVLNYSMPDPLLGLAIEDYARLAREVTIVLHNAWKMDFNMGVEAFEADCLRSTLSLLRLTHAGPPKTFAFTSSISSGLGISSPAHVDETALSLPANPSNALPSGYAQSKFLAEHILLCAAAVLHTKVKLLRVGQLCGHTKTGYWSEKEMWPILLKSAVRLGKVPMLKHARVEWLPLDVAAETIVDVLLLPLQEKRGPEEKRGDGYEVHHIVNPKSISWRQFITLLFSAVEETAGSSEGRLQMVPLKEWVGLLSRSANSDGQHGLGGKMEMEMEMYTPEELPALKLLAFFEDMLRAEGVGNGNGMGKREKVFHTEKTQVVSPSLRGCEMFNAGWLEGNLGVWRESGFWRV